MKKSDKRVRVVKVDEVTPNITISILVGDLFVTLEDMRNNLDSIESKLFGLDTEDRSLDQDHNSFNEYNIMEKFTTLKVKFLWIKDRISKIDSIL